jgi:glycosyltransferase involved in cell wall biosynthesis
MTKCLKCCQKFSIRFILAFILSRILLFEAQPAIAISKAVRNAYLTYFGKIPIELIYYGIDLQKFHPQTISRKILPYTLKDSDKIILFFGRVIKERGIYEFLPHFKGLLQQINCKFLIVGFGPEMPHIKARAKELDLQNQIVYTGILTNKPLINIINLSDIVILPITFPEPLSLVVLEAMACAKPIISFELGGVKELLGGIVPQLMVPPNDWGQFTNKLYEFLNDRELRITVGLALRQRAEKYFNWERYNNSFLKEIGLNE